MFPLEAPADGGSPNAAPADPQYTSPPAAELVANQRLLWSGERSLRPVSEVPQSLRALNRLTYK